MLFATHGYSSDEWRGEGGGVGLGHVTNYAQNVDGLVWGLEQLKQHLGERFGTPQSCLAACVPGRAGNTRASSVWAADALGHVPRAGEEAFGRLWDQVARSAALLCSAALGHMRAEHAALGVPQESAFEVRALPCLDSPNAPARLPRAVFRAVCV